ncbi:hypothetical protein E4T56_gene6138, partial [Termitomyces sp. T112]
KMEEVLGLSETDKMDLAILAAKKRGDKGSMITALENKIKQLESMRVAPSTSLLCRICIDPYNEPTDRTAVTPALRITPRLQVNRMELTSTK